MKTLKTILVAIIVLLTVSCKKETKLTPTQVPVNNTRVAKMDIKGGPNMFVLYFKRISDGTSQVHPLNTHYQYITEFNTNIGDTIMIVAASEDRGITDTTTVDLYINNILVKHQSSLGTFDNAVDLRYTVK